MAKTVPAGTAVPPRTGPEATQDWYHEILENANDVVYTHDLEGRFTSINAAGPRVYGYQHDEFIGMHIRTLVDPAHLEVAAANLRRKAAGETERTPPYELLTRAKDGRPVWVEVSTRAIHEGTRIVGIQGIARDITDRRLREEAEARLREQEHREVERLAELDRYKSDFLRTAAHELGTPLTPIRIQIRMLRDWAEKNPGSREERALAVVDRNLDRLNRLIQDMLQAARLQSGRLLLRRAPMDLAHTVRDVLETFRLTAVHHGQRLEQELAPALPMFGDPDALAQVVGNLVSNAIKYGNHGGLVQVRAEEAPEGLRVTVSDSGIGFTSQQAAMLFQPFMQIHDVLQGNRPGTGLGLYISKGIVEQHGGKIGCSSPGPGCGAEFWFTVPCGEAMAPVPGLAVAPEIAVEASPSSRPA